VFGWLRLLDGTVVILWREFGDPLFLTCRGGGDLANYCSGSRKGI
jgi:hypothetical protein